MSQQQIKEKLEAAGFEVSNELAHQAFELQQIKEEGETLPNTQEATEAFTRKWTHFCSVNTLWSIADQMGYRAGLWA